MAEGFITYKGFPLVRKGNEIYYGNMSDEYVTYMNVVSTHDDNGITAADKIKVFLMKTEKDLDPISAIVKSVDRTSLYDALDIASIWLSREM
ncbi:MAG TPA: hypothetical protein DDX72_03510 [Ruminococcaceae bacterium]|nr:hypothetical protein [Oscillospiraceae bacterium]